MAVPALNIVIEQGVDYEKTIVLKKPDSSLKNLTNKTATAAIKKHPTSDSSTSFEVGITTSTASIAISMGSTLTDTLREGRYYYDVILTDTVTSKTEKAISGMVRVNPSTTV